MQDVLVPIEVVSQNVNGKGGKERTYREHVVQIHDFFFVTDARCILKGHCGETNLSTIGYRLGVLNESTKNIVIEAEV